jgi:hypothetical protein
MSKRKSEAKTGETSKKIAPKKIPKLLKTKLLLLLSEAELAVDSPTIKLFLADKYEYPDSAENKNKVWKTLKDLKSESNRVDFGYCGDLFHGGKESASYLALTSEDFLKHEEMQNNKKMPVEKFTCPHCEAYDYYCQAGETIPGEFPGSKETEYKCLNECFREFTVTIHGNKRIYKWDYKWDTPKTREETLAEDSIHFKKEEVITSISSDSTSSSDGGVVADVATASEAVHDAADI